MDDRWTGPDAHRFTVYEYAIFKHTQEEDSYRIRQRHTTAHDYDDKDTVRFYDKLMNKAGVDDFLKSNDDYYIANDRKYEQSTDRYFENTETVEVKPELAEKMQKLAEWEAGFKERCEQYSNDFSKDLSPDAYEHDDGEQYTADIDWYMQDREDDAEKEFGIDKLKDEINRVEMGNKHYGNPLDQPGKGFVKIEQVADNGDNHYKISGEHVIGKEKNPVTFYASKEGLSGIPLDSPCAVIKPLFETTDKGIFLKSASISDKERNYYDYPAKQKQPVRTTSDFMKMCQEIKESKEKEAVKSPVISKGVER